MFTYLHNPKCSKSRAGLEILNNKNVEFKIREYLKNPLSKDELKKLSQQLSLSPLEFTRKKEEVYKNLDNKELTNDELFELIEKSPILMERPILFNESKAIIGRPPEDLLKIL